MVYRKDSRGRNLHQGEIERSDGRYCYRYTDSAGVRRYIYADDLAGLRAKEELLTKDRVDGIEPDGHLTLNDLFEKHMATKSLKETTVSNYCCEWNTHVRDTLGQAKVLNIRSSDIKIFCAGMSKQGKSRSTIQIVLGLIRSSLELAVEDNIIRHNPAAGITSKDYGKDPAERNALTEDQQAKILEFAREDATSAKHYPLLVILLGTGMRAGEAIALTWDDVDFEKSEIRIDKQLVYKDYGDGYRFHLSTPKTKAGIRTIPMTGEVHDAFCLQKELNFSRGIPRDVEAEGLTGFVFTAADGGPMMPASLNSILYCIVNRYNRREERRGEAVVRPYTPEYMPKFSAHVLRHTACTRMLEAEVQVKTVSYILGHTDCNVTLSVYDHITDMGRVREALENMRVDPGAGDGCEAEKNAGHGA